MFMVFFVVRRLTVNAFRCTRREFISSRIHFQSFDKYGTTQTWCAFTKIMATLEFRQEI